MDDDLEARRVQGLYRRRRRLQSPAGARVRYRGRELINFSSNDYLNLAADARLARSAAAAARRYGTGAAASPLVSGHLPPLRCLERDLARWEQTEAALVFSSGYAANLAVVAALAGPGDALFSDALNHASLIDGCRLSRAAVHVYRHCDLEHLEQLLGREGPLARRRVIVSDSVFSMDGDLAPLAGLVELARRYDCLLVLDEAHATGVIGAGGRGLAEHCGLTDQAGGGWAEGGPAIIRIGTLSKALGSQGGFVCGSRTLVRWLVNFARPYVFSTALGPPAAAAARRAVALVQHEPQRRLLLLRRAEQLRHQLQARGLDVLQSQCQIVPIVLGDARRALELSRRLEEKGLLVPAIRPPSVPPGTARLRISLTAGHTEEDIARLVEALHKSLDNSARRVCQETWGERGSAADG
jgi:8-amino-7-oxononanoate synthase